MHAPPRTIIASQLSLKRITVSSADSSGLLEFISRILSTESSRVIDADVMLSSDSIALDRFLVNYEGRLRLDKLKGMIEGFLRSKNRPSSTSLSSNSLAESNGSNSPPPPVPPSPPHSPHRRPSNSDPLFVGTDSTFVLDDVLTEEIFEKSEPLNKVLSLPVGAVGDGKKEASVRLGDLHVIDKISSSQTSMIFKGIWRKSHGQSHHHHHHNKTKD